MSILCLLYHPKFLEICTQKSVDKQTIINKRQKQIYKTDFKKHQIKRKKTPGWEADVSLPFLKVHFPKNLEALQFF
jgi:hypothetical protein